MSIDYYFSDTMLSRNDCAELLGISAPTFSKRCKLYYGEEAYKARFPSKQQVSDDTKLKIIELVLKTDLSFAEIGKMFDISHTPVSKIARSVLSYRDLDARENRMRKRVVHETNGTNSKTYTQVKAPDWYTGFTSISGWTREHLIVWCKANGKTEVPNGYQVHHIDHDYRNNNPSNLQLMTHGEHTSHHRKKGQVSC